VLPTDKPNQLYVKDDNYKLANSTIAMDWYISSAGYKPYNIYITSDEEIKEGDWYLIEFNGLKITQCTSTEELISIEGRNDCKKIILTTDQALIKDGVQAIDDEFLEWFVKNPSCVFVKITKDKIRQDKEFNDISHWNIYEYKIIIPKEEPKTGSITECIKMIIDNQLNELEELKQETLEEAKQEQKQHLIDLMRLDEDVVIAPACVGQSRLHEQDTVGKEFYESADKTITVYRQETLEEVEENIDREEWINFFKNNSKEEILEYLINYKFPL
jgi:hypothetical protein